MKILILGKNGQIGRELCRNLIPLGDLVALGQNDLDLQNIDALHATLEHLKPQWIINAAAYTAVDQAESEPAKALAINATAVGIIAEFAQKNQALLIHYSTDYVFDGTKKTAYLESDAPQPINHYGASKLAGENAIIASGCQHLIFRTSWVFSPWGHNFIKTILNLAQHQTALSVVDDQYGAPTSAELISTLTTQAIIANRQNRLGFGLYHLSAHGVTNWYQLARYVLHQAKKHKIDFRLDPSKIQAVSSEEYPSIAKRPKNSLLDSSRLSHHLNIKMPEWMNGVDRMMAEWVATKQGPL